MTEDAKPTAIDQEPTANIDEANNSDDDKKKELTIYSWKDYFHPKQMTPILTKRWKYTTGPIFLYYVIQFIFCVAGCNFYSDTTRDDTCELADGSLLEGDAASKVYDTAIMLATIFHIIEWVRSTVLLCVTLLGANFLTVWYVTGVNSLLGLIAFIMVHLAYAGE